jgi:hypothetical protein
MDDLFITSTCENCGEELDDYSPCSCRISIKPMTRHSLGGMRNLIQRKLANKKPVIGDIIVEVLRQETKGVTFKQLATKIPTMTPAMISTRLTQYRLQGLVEYVSVGVRAKVWKAR